MSARFAEGEIVDITIKGARVAATDEQLLQIDLAGGGYKHWLPLAPSVTVTHRAPAEWPPQPGDVWQDADGAEWFTTARHDSVWMVTDGDSDSADNLLRDSGPLTLVRRKGWSPAPAVDQADEPVEARGRVAIVAGLREFADFLESHPEMPLPDMLRLGYGANWSSESDGWRTPSDAVQVDRVKAWASALGVELEHHKRGDGDVGWGTSRMFGAVEVGLSAITPEIFVTPASAEPECAELDDADAADAHSIAATDPAELEPAAWDQYRAKNTDHVITLDQRSTSTEDGEQVDGWLYRSVGGDGLVYFISDEQLAEQYERANVDTEPDADGDPIVPADTDATSGLSS